jgi:hypothetical protein
MKEDRPFVPRKPESTLQLFNIAYDPEAALRVGVSEGVDPISRPLPILNVAYFREAETSSGSVLHFGLMDRQLCNLGFAAGRQLQECLRCLARQVIR